jgi:hypothetical protein
MIGFLMRIRKTESVPEGIMVVSLHLHSQIVTQQFELFNPLRRMAVLLQFLLGDEEIDVL